MAGKLTPEQARELGRQGGKASAAARAERKKLRHDVLAKNRFEQAADDMAEILLAAAKGEGEYSQLSPKDRATFALKALEYGIGRPRPSEPDAPEVQEQQAGLAFAVREEDKVLDALAGVSSGG
jgi:hypothetical protein